MLFQLLREMQESNTQGDSIMATKIREVRRDGGGGGGGRYSLFRKRWLNWIKTWEQLESEETEQRICMNISDLSREEKNRRCEFQKYV